jgi:Flp pilus assembly protein TadD
MALRLTHRASLRLSVGLPLCVSAIALAQDRSAPTPRPSAAQATRPRAAGAAPLAILTTRKPGLAARTAALILTGRPGGPIAISAVAVPVAIVEDRIRFLLVVDIEGTSLLAGQISGALPVEVASYVVNPDGAVDGAWTQAFTINVDRAASVLETGGIKLFGQVDLPGGQHTVRVLVRNPLSNAFGLRVLGINTLGSGTNARFASVPVFSEPALPWLLAGERPPSAAPAYPVVIGGEALIPATRPVLLPEQTHEARVISTEWSATTTTACARVLDATGSPIAPVDVSFLEQLHTPGELPSWRIALGIPGLAPGEYTLEIGAADGGPDTTGPSTLPFVVPASEVGARQLVWAQFTAKPSTGNEIPQARFSRTKPRLRQLSALRDDYLRALRVARAGRGDAAIAEFEAGALQARALEELDRLQAAELEASRGLEKLEPTAVLALLEIHQTLLGRYAQERRPIEFTHTQRLIEALATFLAARGGGAESRAQAASIMAVTADALQTAGSSGSAERLLRRAVLVDPSSPPALASLAAMAERTGRYQDAVNLLERLTRTQPGNAPARVRLGVNLRRRGLDSQAEEQLRLCIGGDSPTWVRTVAYQELAQPLLDREKWKEATVLLREATAASPDDPALALALAVALERSHQAGEGSAIIYRLASTARPEVESSRFRYSQMPQAELDAARNALAGVFAPAQAALARALARQAAGGSR